MCIITPVKWLRMLRDNFFFFFFFLAFGVGQCVPACVDIHAVPRRILRTHLNRLTIYWLPFFYLFILIIFFVSLEFCARLCALELSGIFQQQFNYGVNGNSTRERIRNEFFEQITLFMKINCLQLKMIAFRI